jgi:hypothetical protein
MVEYVATLLHIHAVIGSNLGRKIGYLDGGFHCYSQYFRTNSGVEDQQ